MRLTCPRGHCGAEGIHVPARGGGGLPVVLYLPEGKSDGTRELMIPPGREAAFIQGKSVWKGRIRSLNRITKA